MTKCETVESEEWGGGAAREESDFGQNAEMMRGGGGWRVEDEVRVQECDKLVKEQEGNKIKAEKKPH